MITNTITNLKQNTMENFKYDLDDFCKRHNIDELHLTIKGQDDSYYYNNLDDNEFSFGVDGDMPTNYISTFDTGEYDNGFVVITWPDIQDFMELDGFKDNAVLLNSDAFIDEYGGSAYLVRQSWIDRHDTNL